MEPYAKRKERKTGENRPKISHLPPDVDHRTASQRRAEKQAIAHERRAIKKAARQELLKQMRKDLDETR
jgi:hypothetical protein